MDSRTVDAETRRAPAGIALIEFAANLGLAAWLGLRAKLAAFLKAQRMARMRTQLHGMSDHYLKDIGLHRGDIDRIFR